MWRIRTSKPGEMQHTIQVSAFQHNVMNSKNIRISDTLHHPGTCLCVKMWSSQIQVQPTLHQARNLDNRLLFNVLKRLIFSVIGPKI